MRIAIPLAFLLGIFVAVSAPAQGDEGEAPVSAEALKAFMTDAQERMNAMQATIDTLEGKLAAMDAPESGPAAGEAAGGEDGADTTRKLAAHARAIEALELEASYLRSRETAVSTYLAAHVERADALAALAKRCRELGFTKRAIPADSREALLGGVDALALSLRTGLPELTPEQTAMLAKAAALRKAK